MNTINMYEEHLGGSMNSYEIPKKGEVGAYTVYDLNGNTYAVSEELHKRIKRSARKGVDRPTVELEDGSISGLYTRVQRNIEKGRLRDLESSESEASKVQKSKTNIDASGDKTGLEYYG